MNSIIIFIFVTLSTSAVCFMQMKDPEVLKFSEECAVELGVNLAELSKIDKTDPEAWKKFFRDNPNFKCHGKCIAMKSKIMKEDGEIDLPKMLEKLQLSADESKKFEECFNENKQEDLCMKVNKIMHCYYMKTKV